MGYKVTCNCSVGKGLDFQAGDVYSGPSELVENLLREGLLVEDKAVNSAPMSSEAEIANDDLAFEVEEEKPKKSSKQKRK